MTKARREKKNSYKLLKKQNQESQLPKLKKELIKQLNDKIKTAKDDFVKDECLVLIGKVNLEDLSYKQLLKIEGSFK